MAVDSIGNVYNIPKNISTDTARRTGNTVASTTKTSFKDELQLSSEALRVATQETATLQPSLEEIRSRVQNGYYDQRNIIDQVADRILNSDQLGVAKSK